MDDSRVREAKRLLRQSAAKKRAALSAAYRCAASGQIGDFFLQSPFYQSVASLFVYVSMDGEPDTKRIIERSWADGKAVFVPLCLEKGRMEAVQVNRWEDLAPGAMGIPEPVGRGTGLSPALDLALVPCVCASRDGLRLGHGAGYYDRFLSHRAIKTVCLCFDRMIADDIPTDSLDLPMDAVLTEEGWYFRKKKTIRPLFWTAGAG